jgi:hypothetical protein
LLETDVASTKHPPEEARHDNPRRADHHHTSPS